MTACDRGGLGRSGLGRRAGRDRRERAREGGVAARRPSGGSGPAPLATLWRAALWRAVLVASLFGAPVAGAWGQSREDGPTPRAYRQVAEVCLPEYRKLCPSADLAGPQPRAIVMCLKPYKTSLSLGCRRAIAAVSP